MKPIKLISETTEHEDIDTMIEWLKGHPRLTKGPKTLEFEEKYSRWVGTKHTIFVNSGSSALLLSIYAMKLSKRLKNNKVVLPALSWSTDLAPLIQFGFEPIFCDSDKKNLCVDLIKLETLFRINRPSMLLLVNVLGFTPDMTKLLALCDRYNVTIINDCCETMGTTYRGLNVGCFGKISCFSTFIGHVANTEEGGLICTDDDELHDLIVQLRSHGWSRDLSKRRQNELKRQYNTDDFKSLYTFYVPSFNCRSTDLQAFLGLEQLKKLDSFVKARHKNFTYYQKYLHNDYWKVDVDYENNTISNFAYPIIHPKRDEIVKALLKNQIETRPLIAGSMNKQPVAINYLPKDRIAYCDWCDNIVDPFGIYVPNYPELTESDIKRICSVINDAIKS